jgi:hypothetical protein
MGNATKPEAAAQSCYHIDGRVGNPYLCASSNIYAVKPHGTGLTLLMENAYSPAWQP